MKLGLKAQIAELDFPWLPQSLNNTVKTWTTIMHDNAKADPRLPEAEAVLQECFWNDYTLSAFDLLERLDRQETSFQRFLFSKIINNSRYPSRFLRALFPEGTVRQFLEHELQRSGWNKRVRLVAANFFHTYDLVPEYQWRT